MGLKEYLNLVDLKAVNLEVVNLEAITLNTVKLEAVHLEEVNSEAINLEAADRKGVTIGSGDSIHWITRKCGNIENCVQQSQPRDER